MGDHNANGNQINRRGGRKRPSEEDMTDEEKCKKQKNREAAKRCRERKIEESKNLKKQNEDLEYQNKELTKKKEDLEDKIIQCIRVIRKHQQHGCQLPEDVQGILNGDSERFSSSEDYPDFLPVGAIHTKQNTSLIGDARTFHITENYEDSRTPTGLFSGTEIQIDQKKLRMTKSPSPGVVTNQRKDALTISDSQMKNCTTHGTLSKQSSSDGSQNGYSPKQEIEGSPEISSPVQRVPNIDHMPWSPSAKPNSVDESGDDEYPLYGPRSVATSEIPHTVNVASSFNKLCGGLVPGNSPSPLVHSQINTIPKTETEIKPFSGPNNANISIRPPVMPRQSIPNEASVTRNLQVTSELLSQALQSMNPDDISPSLHSQMVECVKQDYSVNQEEIPQEQQYVYEPHQYPVISDQTTQEYSSIPATYHCYQNVDLTNTNSQIFPSGPLALTYDEQTGLVQNYVVTDKSVGNPGQVQIIYVDDVGPSQQPSQQLQEVEHSQIPTTVYINDEENENKSEQNTNEKLIDPRSEGHTTENLESINIGNSVDNYSANVCELPSLSFTDLQNSTPKEIFDKKPSRLRSK